MGNPRRSADAFAGDVGPDHPQFVNAVARAFSILRCFEPGQPHLGNQDIVRRTGLPKPTVSRLTFTLSALGYLQYLPHLEKYALGAAARELGHAFQPLPDVAAVARPHMRDLAEYTQSAVMLGTADGLRMVLLEVCQGDPTFQLRLEPGARVPHGSTALGRADLAARPLAMFEQNLEELERECEPPLWPGIRAGIVRARQDYEAHGFCFSLGDWNPDVFAVGVPMISADGSRILAFNCSGRVSVMTRDKLVRDFGPRLVALRDRVQALTGGRF